MTIAKLTITSIASLAILLAGLIGITMTSTASAQSDAEINAANYYDEDLDDIEWEAGEGYHEEEWYDPSDWFDMDEGVEYEYDTTYGYYGDTTDYYDADDDWYYDYDYGNNYIFDDYGYDEGIYSYSSDYYDYDGDGVYDAYASYYDWDGDGVYEDYNYYSFTNLGTADQQTQQADKQARQEAKQKQQQKTSKEYQLTGEVQSTKKVQVRKGKNLIAQVKAEQGTFNVDLGPADEASEWNVSEGTQISARGPVTQVGDKKLMLAKNVKIDDQQASIDRSDVKATGTIKSLKTVGVRGTQHQLAVVDVKEKEKKMLVDMGPADKLSQDFSEGDEVTVHGLPVRIKDRSVLMAQKVKYQGETITIDRSQKQGPQSGEGQASTGS